MGLLNKVKETIEIIKSEAYVETFNRNLFTFVGLNNGSGAKTLAVNVAVELAKDNKVCLLDANLFQPGLCHVLDSPVGKESSISRYLNYSTEKDQIKIPIKNVANLWLISASPSDDPIEYSEVMQDVYVDLMKHLKEAFDFVIVYVPYHPFSETFVYTLDFIDKGYFVWDEQIDCGSKTKMILDYTNTISKKANVINNVILNKLSDREYPYDLVKNMECELVAEFPYSKNILLSKNEGRIYNSRTTGEKAFTKGLEKLVADLERSRKFEDIMG